MGTDNHGQVMRSGSRAGHGDIPHDTRKCSLILGEAIHTDVPCDLAACSQANTLNAPQSMQMQDLDRAATDVNERLAW